VSGSDVPRFSCLFAASNHSELQSAVMDAGHTVPADRRSRTKRDVERWVLSRFLESPAAASVLTFPLEIFEGDRPDFLAVTTTERVGIEVSAVTTSVREKYAAVAAEQGLDWHYLPRARLRDHPPPARNIVLQLQDSRSQAWIGYEPENAFADLVCNAIETKSAKMAAHYLNCSKHLLLLYDNCGIPFDWKSLGKSGDSGRINDCANQHRMHFAGIFVRSDGDWVEL